MANSAHGLHHFHKRKRIHVKHEPYPHPKKWVRTMDYIVSAVVIVGPLVALPQILKIWLHKDATGVSLFSWAAFLLIGTCWLIYGSIHKAKTIIITNVIWLIFVIIIVIGTILYG